MSKLFTLVFVLIVANSFGQTRYLDSLFTTEKTDSAVIYGTAEALSPPYFSESSTFTQDLLLDVYQPQNDVNEVRPCVIYMHGGSFLFGSREDANGVNVCHHFAERGYVTVSISYRLGMNIFNSESAERAVYRGVQDFKSAVRYLKENYADYGIDTTRIFAMGSSAGSIAIIHASYVEDDERTTLTSTFNPPDLGCLSCSGNTFVHHDKPIAIANLWGAIVDTSFIEAGDVPMISFHGTNDGVVSADSASPFSSPFFPALSGTNYMFPQLQNVGIYTEYYKFYGEGHEPWGVASETPYYDTIVDKTTLFFYDYLQNNPSNTINQNTIFQNLTIYPNPVADILNVEVDFKESGKSQITIFNQVGQVVYSENQVVQKGNNHLKINTNNLNNGLYYLNIKIDNQQITNTFSKNK